MDEGGIGGIFMGDDLGYASGTIPLSNYLAMVDEGRRWNKEHFASEY